MGWHWEGAGQGCSGAPTPDQSRSKGSQHLSQQEGASGPSEQEDNGHSPGLAGTREDSPSVRVPGTHMGLMAFTALCTYNASGCETRAAGHGGTTSSYGTLLSPANQLLWYLALP